MEVPRAQIPELSPNSLSSWGRERRWGHTCRPEGHGCTVGAQCAGLEWLQESRSFPVMWQIAKCMTHDSGWAYILTWPPSNLSKQLALSVPQFPPLSNERKLRVNLAHGVVKVKFKS